MFNNGIIIDAVAKYLEPDWDVRYEKVEKMEFNYGAMYLVYDFEDGKKVATIKYENDIESFEEYGKAIYERLGSYLSKSGYENEPEYLQLLLILHEFGHLDFLSKMEAHGALNLNNAIVNHTRDLAFLAFDKDDVSRMWEDGVDIPYMLRGDEMYADAYAIKNFIPVITHLQEKGLL